MYEESDFLVKVPTLLPLRTRTTSRVCRQGRGGANGACNESRRKHVSPRDRYVSTVGVVGRTRRRRVPS